MVYELSDDVTQNKRVDYMALTHSTFYYEGS